MRKLSLIHFTVLLLIVLSIAIRFVFYTQTGHNNSPIIKFEFAQSVQEVNELFIINNELNEKELRGVNYQNIVDYLYMIVYTFLLILIFHKIKKFELKSVYILGLIFASIALLSDFIENIQMFKISSGLISGGIFTQNIQVLSIFTYIKWFSLSICFILLSFHYIKFGILGKIFSIISFTPIIAGIISLLSANKIYTIYFSLLIMISFIVLMFWVFISFKIHKTLNYYKE